MTNESQERFLCTLEEWKKLLSYYSPMPCAVKSQGKVTRASRRIDEVFKYDGIVGADIFALTGIKLQEITGAAEGKYRALPEAQRRNFKDMIGSGGNKSYIPLFRGCDVVLRDA